MPDTIKFTVDKERLADIIAERHQEIFDGSIVKAKVIGANGREIKEAKIEFTAEL